MTTRTTLDIWIIGKCLKGVPVTPQMMAYCSNGFFRLAMAAILSASAFCYFCSRQRYKSSDERDRSAPLATPVRSINDLSVGRTSSASFLGRANLPNKMQICRHAGGFTRLFVFQTRRVSFPALENKHKNFQNCCPQRTAVIAVKANCWKSRRNHKPFADETAPFFRYEKTSQLEAIE
jgi:hypothetical protein